MLNCLLCWEEKKNIESKGDSRLNGKCECIFLVAPERNQKRKRLLGLTGLVIMKRNVREGISFVVVGVIQGKCVFPSISAELPRKSELSKRSVEDKEVGSCVGR
jgi:hypothetical protein